MGGGGSTAALQKNSYIEQFVGGVPIVAPVPEEFWEKFLDFKLSVKDSTSKEIEDVVKILCSQLGMFPNRLKVLSYIDEVD